MTKTNKLLFSVSIGLFIFILILLSFFAGVMLGEKNADKIQVSSRSIYEKITESALLTSEIVYLDQKTIIEVNNESEWSRFFWGQTLTAEGLMKVSVGIDLNKISETDILVDSNAKKILIKLPPVEILNTELEGDIETTNQQGILKLLLKNDADADYNNALQQLRSDAIATINLETSIFETAFAHSSETIKSFYEGTGYTVIIEKR